MADVMVTTFYSVYGFLQAKHGSLGVPLIFHFLL